MSASSLEQGIYAEIEGRLVAASGVLLDDVAELLELIDFGATIGADPLIQLIRAAEEEAARWKAEAAEYTALQRAAEKRAESVKGWLKGRMEATGLDRVEGARYKVTLCDSPVSIKWPGDPKELPLRLQRLKIELDTNLAKALYNADQLPSGFEVSRGKHLLIK